MRKQVNLKEHLEEQICSIGAVVASVVGFIVVLYLIIIIVRAFSSVLA